MHPSSRRRRVSAAQSVAVVVVVIVVVIELVMVVVTVVRRRRMIVLAADLGTIGVKPTGHSGSLVQKLHKLHTHLDRTRQQKESSKSNE